MAKAVKYKCQVLKNCNGFINGTVIDVARPGDYEEQESLYNGHKKKHAIKFQTIMAPNGLILHAADPYIGRRHDWRIFIKIDVDHVPEDVLVVDRQQT